MYADKAIITQIGLFSILRYYRLESHHLEEHRTKELKERIVGYRVRRCEICDFENHGFVIAYRDEENRQYLLCVNCIKAINRGSGLHTVKETTERRKKAWKDRQSNRN